MERERIKITDCFGVNLAQLLSEKIREEESEFPADKFIAFVQQSYSDKSYTQRVELIADALHLCLPSDYSKSVKILVGIMGDENPKETGMFTDFYWLMPIGKFIEKYGLDNFDISIKAIEELTKRNTGEYAIRPYLRKYPIETVEQMKIWAQSENFHLRRLSAEGIRPKLPWASKLDIFIDNPKPAFEILDMLKTEQVKFVMKSVANNITDYLKVNPDAAFTLIREWEKSNNKHTQWIIKYATRKIK